MPEPFDVRLAWELAAALLIGALVGVEREKSKGGAHGVGIGGVRTFMLFSLIGAVSAWLSQLLGSAWVFVAAVAAVAALTVAGYVVQSRARPQAVGLTTETAAISMCLLGGACVAGQAGLALAVAIAVSAILAYKQPLHELVDKLGTDDIAAGVKLLAATFIVLPLLPTAAIDPWGVLKPRSLWLLVILIAGLSLVGYVATRALGPARGTAVTGLSGGLVSSTAVTLTFARRSHDERGTTDDALAAGVLLAWGVMFARVVVLAAVVHGPLALVLLPSFGGIALVTIGAAVVFIYRTRAAPRTAGGEVGLNNPFSLTSAVKFGLFFAVVLLAVALVQRRFPANGSYVVAALAGLSDVDAITLSMATLARGGGIGLATAAGSIVVATLSNTLVKCGLIVALASRRLRVRAALVTALMLVAGLGALALL